MHAISISLIGVAVTDVRHSITAGGTPVARFRMVSQPRRFDAGSGSFIDSDASYVTVTAWRAMADNAVASIHKGDPVVVVGKLRVREYDKDGQGRISVEVDAQSLGHDLSRGATRFVRTQRPGHLGGAPDPQTGPDVAARATAVDPSPVVRAGGTDQQGDSASRAVA